jgi:hypothetical protein
MKNNHGQISVSVETRLLEILGAIWGAGWAIVIVAVVYNLIKIWLRG